MSLGMEGNVVVNGDFVGVMDNNAALVGIAYNIFGNDRRRIL